MYKHYWIPCSGCKKPQFQETEVGVLVPTRATCAACDSKGESSVTYSPSKRHKAAPLAPCCLIAGDTDHEPQYPEEQ